MSALLDAVAQYRVRYCLDCGKCASVCPIAQWETRVYTSPRLLIDRAVQGQFEPLLDDPLFWSCLTCQRCTTLCPSGVRFPEFLRELRNLAYREGSHAECTHSEMMHTLGRMMTDAGLKQNRLEWLQDDLEVSDESETLYFVGCIPYYDPIFKPLGVEGVEIAQAAIKILNHIGIQPQVLANERCCGHDQLWRGEFENFRALALLNMETIQASGAKRIVTTCPECARTLKIDYPQFVGEHGLEVLHITELLAKTSFQIPHHAPEGLRVTFQDPCRLGRHLGIYDAPRQTIANLGFELVEMRRHAESSLCCGTSGWSNCGQVSKDIQVERLEEACATGAALLITACQKCQIHFKCAQHNPLVGESISIPIRDLIVLIAEILALQPEQACTQEASLGD